jgi:hypothetical protein
LIQIIPQLVLPVLLLLLRPVPQLQLFLLLPVLLHRQMLHPALQSDSEHAQDL